jgi:hypothetical protein
MVVRIYVSVFGGRAMPVPTNLIINCLSESHGVTEESGGWGETAQR